VRWAWWVRLHPSSPALLARRSWSAAAGPTAERRYRGARAYRDGERICGRADLTISLDARHGVAPRERRRLVVRFVERLDPAFRSELEQLVRRHGAGAARIGDRIESIEPVFDDPQRDSPRLVGRLEPPQWRRWELSENEFVIREHL
jgi:hypothetical protein